MVGTDRSENMYDVELPDTTNHRYYTNGILSHNTTIYTVYILWYAMYHPNKRVMICGNQLNIAIEIMDRIRLGYEYCPSAIKIGVVTYNKQCIEFENNSTIRCFATGSSGTRGFSANCVTGDTWICVQDETGFIEDVQIDEIMDRKSPLKVLTEHGFQEFMGIKKSQSDNVFHVEFDDGEHLAATSEHRIKLDNGAWREVKDCLCGDVTSTGKKIV